MRERMRTRLAHVLIGGLLAAAGLGWVAYETDLTTPGSHEVAFDEGGQAQASAGRREISRPSRLGRLADEARPRAVTVTSDGETREVTTDAATVASVLEALGIELDGNDRVTPARPTPVEAGMSIEVARVDVTRETRMEAVGFDTVETPSDELPSGERQQAQTGEAGAVEIVEEVVLVDGVEESRTRVGARVVEEPRDRVVAVGTAEPGGSAPESEPDAQALVQRHAAEPDPPASAEPAAPEQAAPSEPPPQEPPPQESTGNVQEGEASRYAEHFRGESTASGEPYDPNALTAAHRDLPMGTVVTVTNTATGQSVRVRINDRGPYAEGRIIDLSTAAWNRIASPSAGAVNVRLEW